MIILPFDKERPRFMPDVFIYENALATRPEHGLVSIRYERNRSGLPEEYDTHNRPVIQHLQIKTAYEDPHYRAEVYIDRLRHLEHFSIGQGFTDLVNSREITEYCRKGFQAVEIIVEPQNEQEYLIRDETQKLSDYLLAHVRQ